MIIDWYLTSYPTLFLLTLAWQPRPKSSLAKSGNCCWSNVHFDRDSARQLFGLGYQANSDSSIKLLPCGGTFPIRGDNA